MRRLLRRRYAIPGFVLLAVTAALFAWPGGDGGDLELGTTDRRPRVGIQRSEEEKRRAEDARRAQAGREVPPPPDRTVVGIGDQKPETFSQPLFRSLGVRRTRLFTPWNAVFTEPGRLEDWLSAARAAGLEPLVAFNQARGDQCPAYPCTLPSVAAYTRAFKAFRARYPWVTLIQPWNEANGSTQPTAKNPRRAAEFYNVIRANCPGCRVPAADVIDSTNMERWLRTFRRFADGNPRLWGLHNYSDTNRNRTTGTERLLRAVPGEVWITETGGIVRFQTRDGRRVFPYDERRAAKATDHMFRIALGYPERVTRLYIYQWSIDFTGNRFDAGLVRANGRPRPGFRVARRYRAWFR
jgi:hypothetical protein